MPAVSRQTTEKCWKCGDSIPCPHTPNQDVISIKFSVSCLVLYQGKLPTHVPVWYGLYKHVNTTNSDLKTQ